MCRAISLGVFCRAAPSTRAIMRSRKVSPGLEVIRTTMRSERTFVPPVTAERSPPLSRITGADSPVIADSSTEAMPSTTSPSPGISWPASTTTRSPLRSADAGTCSSPRSVSRRATVSCAHLAQGGGLGLAASLGHGLGEVGEQHREPEPEGHRPREPERRVRGRRMNDVAEPEQRRQHAADLDDEHHRVLIQVLRRQLAEAVQHRPLDDLAGRTTRSVWLLERLIGSGH